MIKSDMGSLTAAVASVKPGVDQLSDSQLADEAGDLMELEAAWKVTERRLKALKEELDSRCKSRQFGPSSPVTFPGDRWDIAGTPCENKTSLRSKAKLLKLVGTKRFIEAVTPTLEAIKGLLAAVDKSDLYKSLTSISRTGPRTFTAVPKMPPAA